MKKKVLILGLLFTMLVVLIASCQNSIQPDTSISNQYFPNKVGDSWTYTVADTAYNSHPSLSSNSSKIVTGTLRVSIINSTKLPDGTSATVWRTVWPPEVSPARPPWNVDTAYVAISGDSVLVSDGLIYLSTCQCRKPQIANIYILPFQTGKNWHLGPDSSRVVSEDTLNVPAGTFNKVYRISSGEGTVNSYLRQDEWFKPGVGLVQKMVSFNGTYYTWKLVDYHVK